MAYQMIHLEVAYRLLDKFSNLTNKADYILGSVAPDSVHMNKNYTVEDKIRSHLFKDCGPWGDTEDYERWLENIASFWNEYSTLSHAPQERDFALGVTVHCLTDFCNDLNIWRKLQKPIIKTGSMSMEEFRADFYPEAKGIDQWLYANSENTKTVFELLKAGHPMDLNNLLNIDDIITMVRNLSENQYKEAGLTDISEYKYLSQTFIEDFLNTTCVTIRKSLTGPCNMEPFKAFITTWRKR